jgi:hypothetical protein
MHPGQPIQERHPHAAGSIQPQPGRQGGGCEITQLSCSHPCCLPEASLLLRPCHDQAQACNAHCLHCMPHAACLRQRAARFLHLIRCSYNCYGLPQNMLRMLMHCCRCGCWTSAIPLRSRHLTCELFVWLNRISQPPDQQCLAAAV